MKKKTVLALLIGIAAIATVFFALKGKEEKQHADKKGDAIIPTAERHKNYVTYEADFGDGYVMQFDYYPGLIEFGANNFSGVVSDDFGQGTTMVTATHVPARYNSDPGLPHTADEYLAAGIDADYRDAVPYEREGAEGYQYWERNIYSYGIGCTAGYNIFLGDEYFYIFSHKNDTWPEDIENVRILKK